MPAPCDGKVALVTGTSRGLGKAIAQRLAREGAVVALTARTMEPDPKYQGSLRQTLAEIEGCGGVAIAIQADAKRGCGDTTAVPRNPCSIRTLGYRG